LDRGDFHAGLQRRQRRYARARRLAIEIDGAGAAQRPSATVLRAGQIEVVAQDPQERRVAGHAGGNVDALLVDEESRHESSPDEWAAASLERRQSVNSTVRERGR